MNAAGKVCGMVLGTREGTRLLDMFLLLLLHFILGNMVGPRAITWESLCNIFSLKIKNLTCME